MQATDVRAADADRERVLADLQRHTSAGRLGVEEFSERAAAVLALTLAAPVAVWGAWPFQPAFDAGGARRARHPADRQLDPLRSWGLARVAIELRRTPAR